MVENCRKINVIRLLRNWKSKCETDSRGSSTFTENEAPSLLTAALWIAPVSVPFMELGWRVVANCYQWPFAVKLLYLQGKRRGFCFWWQRRKQVVECSRNCLYKSAGCCLLCRSAEGTLFANMIFSAKRKLQFVWLIIKELSFMLTMSGLEATSCKQWNSCTANNSWKTTKYPWTKHNLTDDW